MWGYLKGVQNPAVKRKLSEETKKKTRHMIRKKGVGLSKKNDESG
jgi:hypothetical protein